MTLFNTIKVLFNKNLSVKSNKYLTVDSGQLTISYSLFPIPPNPIVNMKKKLFRFLGMLLGFILVIVVVHNLLLSSASTSSDIVNIKLSGWGASSVEQKLLKQLLRDFELEHPDIKVKYEVINDQYMDVIKTRLIGEAAPDVFYLDALEAPFLMSQNVLEPLNSYINSEFDLSDFEQTLLNSFKYENQIYGLPKDYSTLALFYPIIQKY